MSLKQRAREKIEPQHIYCMYCGHGSNLSFFPFPLAVGEETFRLFSVIMHECNNFYIVDIVTS